MKPIFIILALLALLILCALLYKRDTFWDMFKVGYSEPVLQDTTIR